MPLKKPLIALLFLLPIPAFATPGELTVSGNGPDAVMTGAGDGEVTCTEPFEPVQIAYTRHYDVQSRRVSHFGFGEPKGRIQVRRGTEVRVMDTSYGGEDGRSEVDLNAAITIWGCVLQSAFLFDRAEIALTGTINDYEVNVVGTPEDFTEGDRTTFWLHMETVARAIEQDGWEGFSIGYPYHGTETSEPVFGRFSLEIRGLSWTYPSTNGEGSLEAQTRLSVRFYVIDQRGVPSQ